MLRGLNYLPGERDMPPQDTTVFIVDDDWAVRDSMAALVEVAGFLTESFASVDEFLHAHHALRRGCLVANVFKLGMSGLELLDKLAVKEVDLPMIIITADEDGSLTERAMRSSTVILLERPWHEPELTTAIRKALALDARNRQAPGDGDAAE